MTASGGNLITDACVGRRVDVVLNMAASLDGRVAGAGGKPVRLSSGEDLDRVHALRADSDAIVVGIGTVLADDPRLTVRRGRAPGDGEQPTRVVVDSQLRTPEGARVLDEAAPTIVFAAREGQLPGAEVHTVPGEDGVDLTAVLSSLEEDGVEHLLLEGGPTLAASALAAGLVDRLHLYLAPRVLGEGPSLADAWRGLDVELAPRSRSPLGEGTLVSYDVIG